MILGLTEESTSGGLTVTVVRKNNLEALAPLTCV
jgi:hypothetical protein